MHHARQYLLKDGLAGVDLYDIMKVTGHSSPAMLKKYIRADSLKVVEKLADKYDYFNRRMTLIMTQIVTK